MKLLFAAIIPFLLVPLATRAAPKGHHRTVALGVPPLELKGYVSTATATRVRSILEKSLQGARRLDLVERQRVEDVLEELAFQQSGVTAPGSVTPIGEHVNIDKLLFCALSRIGRSHILAVKIVDVSTNEIVWSDSQELGFREEQLAEGTERLGRRLANAAIAFEPVEMITLPSGRFTMGSESGLVDERPPHPVRIAAFELDRTEVSRAAYSRFSKTRGVELSLEANGDHPVALVSWHDANAYCRHLGKRLPTEAEWEYAARGSQSRPYPWGSTEPDMRLANFGATTLSPVAVDEPLAGVSESGAQHLVGNVAEWVADWWDPGYYATSGTDNPTGPPNGEYKVVRGGSWTHSAFEIRAAARAFHNPARGASYLGFRCARDLVDNR